jgi:DNA-directed RNA polymerase specialized sigma24 family protein
MSGAIPDRADELPADVAWVRRLAAGLVGDRSLADDLAQEAWLVALRRPDALAAARGPAERRAFLAGVLRRLAWKSGRGAARRTAREAATARPEGSSDDLVSRAELVRELVGHVLALDEPFRSALLLRYLDGLPPR